MELDPQITGFLILLANAAGTIITLKVKSIKQKAADETKDAQNCRRHARAVIDGTRKALSDKTMTPAEVASVLRMIDAYDESLRQAALPP